MEAVEQALLQTAGACQGKTGEHATVQSESHSGYSGQYGYAESAANPLLYTQSTLHGGEDAAAGEQGNRQRGRCSRCVAQAGGWRYERLLLAGLLRSE